MQFDGSAPTIATRQLPRSGFVQGELCGVHGYVALAQNAFLWSTEPSFLRHIFGRG
jgi:hypothetical protein